MEKESPTEKQVTFDKPTNFSDDGPGLQEFNVMENSLPLQSNEIRTSKYNLLTFLPLNIMH